MNDKYYIVEFKDGVQLVPAKWLDKSEKYCSFPFYDKLRYDQAVKYNEDADHRWRKYKVIRKMGTASKLKCFLKFLFIVLKLFIFS